MGRPIAASIGIMSRLVQDVAGQMGPRQHFVLTRAAMNLLGEEVTPPPRRVPGLPQQLSRHTDDFGAVVLFFLYWEKPAIVMDAVPP